LQKQNIVLLTLFVGGLLILSGCSAPDSEDAPALPDSGAQARNYLSTMLTYEIIDSAGQEVGPVEDYIINMCEAYLLYVVVEASETLESEDGSNILIPYEAFTLDGEVRADGQSQLVLNQPVGEVVGAPVVDLEELDMTTNEWEPAVEDFWTERTTMTFNSGCPVPAAGDGSDRQWIVRIALAEEVLETVIVDGNDQLLADVEEILLTPESGHLRYVVARLDQSLDPDQNLVLIPIGALNVNHENQPGTTLVLLVDNEVLLNAPRLEAIPDSTSTEWEGRYFEYWSQHVPMTREDLP
jgi:sporulation protein YlmC with PRC-barrel domain